MRGLSAALWSSGLFLLLSSSLLDAKKLRLRIGTWNVAESSPGSGIEELAGLSADSPQPDLIALGMQEITMKPAQAVLNKLLNDNWSRALEPELARWGYKKVKTVRLVGILLNVFAHEKHWDGINMVKSGKLPTGLGGLYGNKGGVMLAFDLYDSRLRFINAHLPAHDGHKEGRIRDYEKIQDGLQDEKEAQFKFWLGDLNFRLDEGLGLSAEGIEKAVERGELGRLLQFDELADVMHSQRAFTEFTEQPINFKPTFKLIQNRDDYNTKRRPAWTDRVLYSPSESIEPLSYTSLEGLRQSDHRPVVADFILDV